MKSPKWSVVLIGKNEEKTLPRLLSSLKEFKERGGEIILVDTNSTDKTVEIAKSFGIKVYEEGDRFRKHIDDDLAYKINNKFLVDLDLSILKDSDSLFDYSSARNYATSLANNDLVAMPDCDEEYTMLDIDKINAVIESGYEQLEYQFVFSHDNEGKPVIQFLHCKFYDRTKLKWTGIIHEVLTGEAKRTYLDESVIKLEHWQNHGQDRSGYLRGLALDCYENPENDRNSHYFARELMWTGRIKSAIEEFKRHIAMDKWPAERSQSMVFIGECLMKLGKEEEALDWYWKAFKLESGRREPLIRLGTYYAEKADPVRAAAFMRAAMEIPYTGFYADNMSHYREVPNDILKWAYNQLGKTYES